MLTISMIDSVFDVNQFEQNIRDFFVGNSVGIGYAINQGGVTVRSDGWGDARRVNDGWVGFTPDTQMTIASVAKTITATGALKILQDTPGVGIDSFISPYLPSGWVQGPGINSITFRELLTHHSGLRRQDWNGDGDISLNEQTSYGGLQQFIAQGLGDNLLLGLARKLEFSYENANFALLRVMTPYLLGDGAEADSAEDPASFTALAYVQYVSADVLAPMGIENANTLTFSENPTLNYPFPGAGAPTLYGDRTLLSGGEGWWLSANELAKFLIGVRSNNDVLSPATRELMRDGFLGWMDPHHGYGFAEGAFGTYYSHGGDLNNLHTGIIDFPNGVQAALLINSEFTSAPYQLSALELAFQSAWPEISIVGTSGDDDFEVRHNLLDINLVDIFLNNNLVVTRTLESLEKLTLSGLSGNDTFNVAGLSDNIAVVLRGGSGNDLFSVLDTDIGIVQGDVTIDGGDDADALIFNEGWVFGDATYTIADDTISKSSRVGQIHYEFLEVLTVHGGSGNDTIFVYTTDSGVEVRVFGNAGDDTILGGLVNDLLMGGDGDDFISGGPGNDRIYGGAGNDILVGGVYSAGAIVAAEIGNDLLDGGDGHDTIYGDSWAQGTPLDFGLLGGDDTIQGGYGNDTIYGQTGNDFIAGGLGDDLILCGLGNDIASGDGGNDIVAGEEGDDLVSGGHGNDTVTGGSGNDILVGGVFTVGAILIADTGDDLLDGGHGHDSIYGDSWAQGNPFDFGLVGGDDTIHGGEGNDTIYGQTGNDFIGGGLGDDLILCGLGNDIASGDGGNDIVAGEEGDDLVAGGHGNDTVTGGSGNDILVGGLFSAGAIVAAETGDDWLDGGDGHDTIYGDSWALGAPLDFGLVGGDDTIHGGDGNDRIYGQAGNDFIGGGLGDDLILCGLGNDIASGDGGNDIVAGEEGDDLVAGGHGNDTVTGGSGNDILVGGLFSAGAIVAAETGDDRLDGGDGHDTIYGDSWALGAPLDFGLVGGDDTIHGGDGNDRIYGQAGNDILVVSSLTFIVVIGGSGSDTLRLSTNGLSLDLTAMPDDRILEIEQIDLTGTGDNSLTLTQQEVLNISGEFNTLIVLRNLGDVVNIGRGWTQQPNEVIDTNTFEVFSQGSATVKIQVTTAAIVGRFVNHFGYTGSGSSLDTGKVLAREGMTPQTLTYNNLINTSRGINGLVFDLANLPGTLTADDFEFQMSPQSVFDQGLNPPRGWTNAPAPIGLTVAPGTPSRVAIQWANNAIANRWLRVTVKANANTGLAAPEVYYIGHLLGETTGITSGFYTVSFADITPIRTAVGQSVNAGSIHDIDKNGTVAFADISAMRGNVGAQLTNFTIPATGGGGGSGPLRNSGSSSAVRDPQQQGTLRHAGAALQSLVAPLPQIIAVNSVFDNGWSTSELDKLFDTRRTTSVSLKDDATQLDMVDGKQLNTLAPSSMLIATKSNVTRISDSQSLDVPSKAVDRFFQQLGELAN